MDPARKVFMAYTLRPDVNMLYLSQQERDLAGKIVKIWE